MPEEEKLAALQKLAKMAKDNKRHFKTQAKEMKDLYTPKITEALEDGIFVKIQTFNRKFSKNGDSQ